MRFLPNAHATPTQKLWPIANSPHDLTVPRLVSDHTNRQGPAQGSTLPPNKQAGCNVNGHSCSRTATLGEAHACLCRRTTKRRPLHLLPLFAHHTLFSEAEAPCPPRHSFLVRQSFAATRLKRRVLAFILCIYVPFSSSIFLTPLLRRLHSL